MGEALEIAKALVEPGTKLMELVGRAVGTMYAPHHERKMADAEAYRIKTISEAVKESSFLPVTYNKDGISISAEDANELYQRAEMREQYQKIQEQRNIENVIEHARCEMIDAPCVENTPVDDDWINRLLKNAKEVNSETMQFIWGKILAGEVSKPGSFSLRTLEVIRNLSKEEAKAFQEILPFVVNQSRKKVLLGSQELNQKYGISYLKLELLSECGLLGSENGNIFNMDIIGEDSSGFYNKSRIMYFSDPAKKNTKITYGGYTLTKAAVELETILEYTPNTDYFLDLAEEFYHRSSNLLKICVHKVNCISEDNINYEDEPLSVFGE